MMAVLMTRRLGNHLASCLGALKVPCWGAVLLLIAGAASIAGCATDFVPRSAVPVELVDRAIVSDFKQVRFWGDSKPGEYKDLTKQRIEAVRQAFGPNVTKISRTAN